eukprot:349862-Chlamydomonas_euryale.AAC.7
MTAELPRPCAARRGAAAAAVDHRRTLAPPRRRGGSGCRDGGPTGPAVGPRLCKRECDRVVEGGCRGALMHADHSMPPRPHASAAPRRYPATPAPSAGAVPPRVSGRRSLRLQPAAAEPAAGVRVKGRCYCTAMRTAMHACCHGCNHAPCRVCHLFLPWMLLYILHAPPRQAACCCKVASGHTVCSCRAYHMLPLHATCCCQAYHMLRAAAEHAAC